ncbi:MAG: Zinc-dependent sulfurtransferase SufU [Phycisphaerae bacterium]|nr:Zinc-dependent sulfurtransferase SufU [Phycisphaerae bacterium]
MSGELDLDELYQQVILDHSRKPRNFRELACANCRCAEGHNPLCGDRVTIYIEIEQGRVQDVSFSGSGCAICTASASMMTDALKGKTVEEARRMFTWFHDMLTGKVPTGQVADGIGKLAAFSGVLRFPIRVKCATLPWHTMAAALAEDKADDPVSTE